MQTNLINKKIAVQVKESYGGFSVVNPNHVDFDNFPKIIRYGSEMVKKHKSYEEAKEYFENECRKDYGTSVEWLTSKFPDSCGFFWLEGVKVNWELEANYIIGGYHFIFNTENKKPCLLTETGYKSYFPTNLDYYDTIKRHLVDYVEFEINEGKKSRKYRLDFEDEGYIPSKQLTLIEKGGGKHG